MELAEREAAEAAATIQPVYKTQQHFFTDRRRVASSSLLIVALLTMALLTMALLTMALLTMALLTMALLTMALLTMAILTMALLIMALLTMALLTMEGDSFSFPTTSPRYAGAGRNTCCSTRSSRSIVVV